MNFVAISEQRRRREAQDLLALDIQRGDEDISISIRSVIERGYSDTFKESLDASLKKKTSEIERISARHYGDFLMSTRSMFEIRGAAGEIGGVVKEINTDFTESGNKLVDVLTELESYQKEREKTRVVFEGILRCKELSELMQRSRRHFEEKDYYAALRSIILLRDSACASPQDRALPQPMIDILSSWWPTMSRKIYEAVVADADAHLDLLREKVMTIGQVALKRQAMVALGANKYSLLTVSTSAAAASSSADSASSGGMHDYFNTPGGNSYAPSVFTAASGADPGSREGLSTDDYKSLFARLPLLYRAPSFSLQQVKRCLHALRLHSWAREGDLDAWLSLRLVSGQKVKDKDGGGGSAKRRRSASSRTHRLSRGSLSHSNGGSDSGSGRHSPANSSGASQRMDRRSPVPGSPHPHQHSHDDSAHTHTHTHTHTHKHSSSFHGVAQRDYLHPVSEADEDFFDGITEGLGPLFCALHVCEVLQLLPTLHARITQRRASALDSILSANEERMKTLSLTDKDALSSYISELSGFFVLETMVAASIRTASDSYSLALQGGAGPAGDPSQLYSTHLPPSQAPGLADGSGRAGGRTRPGGFAQAAIEDFCGHGQVAGPDRAGAALAFMFAPCSVEMQEGGNTGVPAGTAGTTGYIDLQEESPDGSFSYEEIARLWHHASVALDTLVAKQAHSLRTPEQLLVVKDEVCLMSDTFVDPSVDLPCHNLSETTRLLWTQFEELQILSTKEAVINLLFSGAAFSPLVLDSFDDYRDRVLDLDLQGVPSVHVAIDRAVRERLTKEGGAHMGRGAAVFSAAMSVNKAVAREIVAGTVPFSDASGGAAGGPGGSGASDGFNGRANGGPGAGGDEDKKKETTPRQRASVLLGNLDALEEDAMGGGAAETAAGPASVSSLSPGPSQRGDPDASSTAALSQSSHSESASALTPLTDRSRLSSFSSVEGARTPSARRGSGNGNGTGGTSASVDDYYPPGMSFSHLVSGVQRFMYIYVTRLVGFAAKNPPLGDVCETACSLLLRAQECAALAMTDEIHRAGGEIPMNKACQICVDAASLAIGSGSVWTLLRRSLHTLNWYRESNSKVTSMLAEAERTGRMLYMKVSLLAQATLFDVIKTKTLELLDSVLFIEYLPATLPRTAHEGITDIVSFLEAKMDTLSALPRSARDIAQFTACNTVAEGLLTHLVSPQVKAINVLTLAALDLDCRRMIQYAHATGVPSLNQCFAETHEIIQASIHPDVAKLSSDEKLRKRLFPKMDPLKLAALLEKVVPLESAVSSASLPRHTKVTLQKACEQLRRKPSPSASGSSGAGAGGKGRGGADRIRGEPMNI